MLERLKPPEGAVKKRKRVGRGRGSGHGKTSTRGHKGQRARSGGGPPLRFEGGQTPLLRRLPKRGFSREGIKVEYEWVNVKSLNIFKDGDEVTPEVLKERGLIKRDAPVKILGDGDLNVKLKVRAHAFSKSAIEKIKRVGGEIEYVR
jgi:large subunit ribosomal protein L15